MVVVNYEVGGDFCEGGGGVEMESLSCGEDEVMNGMNVMVAQNWGKIRLSPKR